mgnify:CR=1 FL=1
MKKWKRLLVSLLTVAMTIGTASINVMAAEPYTYTVTLSAGNKGTINGQNKIEVANLSSDSTVTFNLNDIQVTDDRYYVKGIRLSGRDNAEALAAPAFNVDGDADYVVAYGIKGNQVAYTVQYQDEDGNTLAESQTFYGNVGDKPVVAYRYIENFIPQALALTKTLSENEADNVFTFTYAPGETNRVVETTTTITTVVPGNTVYNTVTVPAGTVAGGTTTGGTNAAGGNANGTTTGGTNVTGGNANETTTPGGTTDANGGRDADQDNTVENTDEQTPQGLVDLDDEDTPTGNIDAGKSESVKTMNFSIAIIVAAAVAIVALLVALRRRSKETK